MMLSYAMAAVPAGENRAQRHLAPCPGAPNCVNSLDPDPARRVAPLAFSGSAAQARERLIAAVESLPRARIVEADAGWLRAEFVSRLFRFVDDVEFVIDEAQSVIHLRSAARSGYYDFGVNRRRVEEIREAFERSGVSG